MEPLMTNFLLAVVYNEHAGKDDDGENIFVTKVNKLFFNETLALSDIREKVKTFLIEECGFKDEEIPSSELTGLIDNFGIWDEKTVTYGILSLDNEDEDTSEDEPMPFIKANALAAEAAFNIKREDLIKRLDEEGSKDAKKVRPKGIKFTEAEATSGRERTLQIMSETIQSL